MASRRKRKAKANSGGNKPLKKLNARKKAYLATIDRLGFSGDINNLPKKWAGFTCPGSLKR